MTAPDIGAALRAVVEAELAPLRAELAELRERLEERPRRMCSPAEAAERLGVSLPTVRRYLRAGLIKSTRVRRRVLVDLSTLPDAGGIAARARVGI